MPGLWADPAIAWPWVTPRQTILAQAEQESFARQESFTPFQRFFTDFTLEGVSVGEIAYYIHKITFQDV